MDDVQPNPREFVGEYHTARAVRPRMEADESGRMLGVVEVEMEGPGGSVTVVETVRLPLWGALTDADRNAALADRCRFHVEQRDAAMTASPWLNQFVDATAA